MEAIKIYKTNISLLKKGAGHIGSPAPAKT
jgi:hypothetical protein